MRIRISGKIKIFRILYLAVSLSLCGYTAFLMAGNIISGFKSALSFKDVVNLFALLFAFLFETAIVLFIIRSLRSQTILMKNLVFKPDGTPFKMGVILVSCGGFFFTGLSALFFCSPYAGHFFDALERNMRLFIADVTLIFGANLLFTFAYFITFRHESGTFELI